MADRYWVGGTANWDGTAGTKWALTSGGAGGQAVPTASDDVYFDAASGANTVTVSGSRPCLSFNATGFTGTLAGTSTPNLQVHGNLTLGSGMTVAGTLTTVTFLGVGSFTITTNGISLVNVTFNNAGDTWTLQDNLTATGTVTLTAGTLALSSYTLACNAFVMTSTSVKTLDFGTGKISLNGTTTGTVWNSASNTNTTLSGTVLIEITAPGSGVTKTISSGTTTISPSLNFSVVSGSTGGTITFVASMQIGDLTLGNFSYTVSNIAISIYGSLNVGGTNVTLTAGTNAWTFAAASGTETLTSNGATLDFPITFNGASGTWQLQDAFTVASGRTVTFTDGALDLQSYTFTTGIFSSSNSNTRSVAFGTGKIVLTGSGTVWSCATATNFTTTGTNKTVEPALGAAQTITPGTPTETDAIDISVPATAGNFTLTITGSDNVRNLTFANAVYTVANTEITIYGSLTILGTSPTFTAGTNTWTFSSAATTHQITTSGKTLDFPISVAGTAPIFQLQDALTMGLTRTFGLGIGTLDLQSYTFTLGLFSSSNSNTRTIAFGTGKMVFNGTVTATSWTTSTVTNLTITGSKVLESTAPASGTKTFTFGSIPEAQTLNLTVITGGGTGTITPSGNINNLTLQNASYTFDTGNLSVFGNLLINGTSPSFSSANTLSMAATSGTKTITTNGCSIVTFITINGVGGTFQLEDAITLATNRTFTFTNGTLNLQSYTLTTGVFTSNSTNSRTLNFGTGKILISGTSTTAFNGTNFTTTGSKLVERTGAGTTTFDTTWTESNALNFSLVSGISGNNTITGYINTLNVGNFTLSLVNINISLFGNLVLGGTNITWSVSNTNIIFRGTTGTQLITTNGVTIRNGMTFEGGATYQLQDAVTLAGSATIFPALTLNAGTLDLNDYTFTTVRFATSGTTARSIDFGTGKIVLTCSDTAQSAMNMSGTTNYSVSGTNLFELSSTYNARTFPGGTASNAPNLSFLASAIAAGLSGEVNDFTVAGSGNQITSEGTLTVYGDFTVNGTGLTFFLSSTSRSLNITFAATSSTQTITTNGANIDANVTFNGVGGTWIFADNFEQTLQLSKGTFEDFGITLTNGALQLNGNTLFINFFRSNNTNTRGLDFTGGGDIRIISDNTVYTGTNLLDINCSNLTVTNPGVGFITADNQSSSTPKEFLVGKGTTTTTLPTIRNVSSSVTLYINSGGGVRLYNLAGTPSANQSYTFNTTANGVYYFDNFGVTPNVGSTVTFNTNTGTGQFTFSQSGGVIDNQRLNITNSIATGGATWYAGSTSTDGGNNSGWIFSNAPTDTGNAMFLMFI